MWTRAVARLRQKFADVVCSYTGGSGTRFGAIDDNGKLQDFFALFDLYCIVRDASKVAGLVGFYIAVRRTGFAKEFLERMVSNESDEIECCWIIPRLSRHLLPAYLLRYCQDLVDSVSVQRLFID
jgi:hypothetical protein